MKSRLNITVDNVLAQKAKHYAAKNNTSVSQLVEEFFLDLTRPVKRKNILDLIEELPKPAKNYEDAGKEDYYSKQLGKYGH